MNFGKMLKKYPEMTDDLTALRTNITTKTFWIMIICIITGGIIGFMTAIIIGAM